MVRLALSGARGFRAKGIGYLEIPLNREPSRKTGKFDRWLSSIELLARLFPSWVRFARSSINWLMEQRDEQGFWDFGARTNAITFLPLSDSWRERRQRQFDWTTRSLILLRRYYDEARFRRINLFHPTRDHQSLLTRQLHCSPDHRLRIGLQGEDGAQTHLAINDNDRFGVQ